MFFFSSRSRHTRWPRDWSSDVCSSDLVGGLDRSRDDLALLPTGGGHQLHPGAGGGQGGQQGPGGQGQIGRASCRERVEIAVVGVVVRKDVHPNTKEKSWINRLNINKER